MKPKCRARFFLPSSGTGRCRVPVSLRHLFGSTTPRTGTFVLKKKKKPTKKIKKKRKNRSRNLALKENPMDENGDFFFALGKGVKPPKNTVKNSVTKLISLCLLCCGKTR